MKQLLLIGLGSGLGGMSRYLVSTAVYHVFGKNFPYGTLAVNIMGCFVAGFLATFFLERFNTLGVPLRALLIIGFLGGFTTFSSFSVETLNLFESGKWALAFLNVVMSFVCCLTVVAVGAFLARHL